MKHLRDLKKLITKETRTRLVVVAAEEENILEAVNKAYLDNLVEPILIGNENLILKYINKNNLKLKKEMIIPSDSFEESSQKAVELINNNEGDFLIKGLVDTAILLKAVLNKDWGLRTDSILSHLMIYEIPSYHKLLMLTDGGMVTYPDVDTKVKLIENAYEAAKKLGYEDYKVACLAAKEKLNPKMQATIDGQELKDKYLEGRFPQGVIVEGPIALDLAISKEAASIKNFQSPVAGEADLLLVHNIEMGNGIGKAITYFGEGIGAGVVMGAKVPIVLVSRADDFNAKYYSILLGSVVAAND